MSRNSWLILFGVLIYIVSCVEPAPLMDKTLIPAKYYAFKIPRDSALKLMMAIDPGQGGGKGLLVMQHQITRGTSAGDSLGLIIYPYKRDLGSYGFGDYMFPIRDSARTMDPRDTIILGNISISFAILADKCFLDYSANPNPKFGLDFDTLMVIPQWGTGPGETNHLTYRMVPYKDGKPIQQTLSGCGGMPVQQQPPGETQMRVMSDIIYEEFHPSPPAKPDY